MLPLAIICLIAVVAAMVIHLTGAQARRAAALAAPARVMTVNPIGAEPRDP
jgi:hypothetical protein